jgi:membrane-associated phospholipid phosphatase
LLVYFCFFCANAYAKSSTEAAGDVLHVLIPASAFVGSLYLEKESEAPYEGGWQLAKSGVTSRVTVEVLKASITKNRPDGSDDDAFPSGHTADTFAAATFVQQRYGWKYATPAYLAATYVGYSRVKSDKHETIDVLSGAAIGVLSGLYFTSSYSGVKVIPLVSKQQGYGVSISSRF